MASKTTTSTPKKSTPKKSRTVRKETPAPKPSKPVFRTGTWVSVLLLAALLGFFDSELVSRFVEQGKAVRTGHSCAAVSGHDSLTI